ncbi:protein phosphatase 2C, putative [Trypanosoma equiperdum]|uniref:Protein phosphatase 2C, putative n=1 Tax=Trypanosoma equiperdum TaxID=5694 RepID=A0A1G4I6L3_TRYEQ|nr:protein phosphatase 2C, putative [Trypanosoma equiperdum]
MYTSVRKPPLSTAKLSEKTDAAGKGNLNGVAESPTSRDGGIGSSMPYVARKPNSGDGQGRPGEVQRAGQVTYQTTNALFTGSTVPGKTKDVSTAKSSGGGDHLNNGDRPPLVGDNNEVSSPRTIKMNSSPPRRYFHRGAINCNSSENVAAVLGGSTLISGERVGSGSGYPRRVFSGPPSTRMLNQGGEEPAQKPQPPGSSRSKSGIRQLQFALNGNSSQRLLPVPPRQLCPSNPARRGGGAATVTPRCSDARRQKQDSTDPFDMTQVLNGVGTQLGLPSYCPGAESSQGSNRLRGSKPPSPSLLPLASLRSQQMPSTAGVPAPRSLSESQQLSINPSGVFGCATDCKNGLGYDFRVVASTGKSFNLPIKLTAGVGCVQGLRPTMEDEHFIRLQATTAVGQPVSLLGILDGHCGRRVAELAAKHVPDNFIAHPALGENNALAFVESIIQADRAIFHSIGKGSGGVGLSAGFGGSGGSTLIAAAVHGRMLYVACLGDARAVLYDGNTTIPMSEDHKPLNKKEHTRILQCGGFVQLGRVCGVLAVSRALGDYEFKFNGNRFISNRELMVSNVADVRQINLTDSSKFLLLACDGLWDAVQNEEATQFVRDFLSYTPDVGSSPEATKRAINNCCQKLAEFAVSRGSTDNVSVMLLFFHNVADVVASFDRASDATTSRATVTSPVSPRLFSASRGVNAGFTGMESRLAGISGGSSSGAFSGSSGAEGSSVRGAGRTKVDRGASWLTRSRSLW